MPTTRPTSTRSLTRLGLAAVVLATPLLHGCASTQEVQWSRVSLKDRHGFAPSLVMDNRPAAVFLAGPSGAVVNLGDAVPATRLAQGGPVHVIRLEGPATQAAMAQVPGLQTR